MNSLLQNVVFLVKKVGKKILSYYHSDFKLVYKADNSPVTSADIAAHKIICQALKHLTPEIPIISEELNTVCFAERQRWQRYWLIDPLDGTKEFIEKNGEFTINIALIENNLPILGVVYAPVFDFCYFAKVGGGAYKQVAQQTSKPLNALCWKEKSPITIIISRQHGTVELKNLFEKFSVLNLIRCGSALKFCWVAEGFADVYSRLSPTYEWDTAAGHCILNEAGGAVIDLKGRLLRYNTMPSLLNPAFLAVGDKNHPWKTYMRDN